VLLLQFLAKELHDTRLMVLGTFRDAEARRSAEQRRSCCRSLAKALTFLCADWRNETSRA